MASGATQRRPIVTGLRDRQCHFAGLHRCNPCVARCLSKTSAPAVPDASRRLVPRDTPALALRVRTSRSAVPATFVRRNVQVHASAFAATDASGENSEPAGCSTGARGFLGEAQHVVGTLSKQASRFWDLSGKFMPMVGLFFMLAFVNTILDSLKDTLVITAVGGGAQVIPYLTVYAVLPSSLVFLLLYSYASQRFRRQALFNGIVAVFMAFFVGFAGFLYPNHHLLHPSGWADGLAATLPLGLDGLVGMIRNWTFTLFFCMSELWGDVCLGLLFWGLANDTTSLADAPTLYPLFGLGANVAQALAGFVLKFFSGSAASSAAHSAAHSAVGSAGAAAAAAASSFTSEVRSLMGVVLLFSFLALALHHYISMKDNQQRMERLTRERARRAGVAAAAAAVTAAAALQRPTPTPSAPLASESASTTADVAAAAADGSHRTAENQMQPTSVASTSGAAAPAFAAEVAGSSRRRKGKQNLTEIYRTLASSVPIRCLVVMSMAQGLCTNLMEFAWKSHIRLLYPSPAEFTSFLGDVSTWQGIVTGMLMVLSPTMFKRLGWAGVAAATPRILLYGGGLFFATAMAYQFLLAPSAASAASAAGLGVLQLLVYGGALLYVFSKSAKFSLFKPAEEMVYISLDEEGRTKGKAAIDVVGSQAGKSGGSVLQQVLLLLCGGAIAGQLPAMVAVYLAMSQSWLRAVSTLSTVNNYGHASSVHESMQGDSLDHPEDDPQQDMNGPAGLQEAVAQATIAPDQHQHQAQHHHQQHTHHHNHQQHQEQGSASVNGQSNGPGHQNGTGHHHHRGFSTSVMAAESVVAARTLMEVEVQVEIDESVQQAMSAAGYSNANSHHYAGHANGHFPNGSHANGNGNGNGVHVNGVNGHANGNSSRPRIRDALSAAA